VKILIHCINFSPELTGIGKYSGEMAEWLAGRGHEVRVVTAPPYYPQWHIAAGYANRWSVCVMGAAKLKVFRCPLWVPMQPSGIKRVLHLMSFMLSSFPVMLSQIFWKPNIVLVIEPPLFCAPQALLVSMLSGAKAWLHIQDFEVDAAFELGLLGSKRARQFASFLERFGMQRFDRVSTISGKMSEKLAHKGVEKSRVVLFPNWVGLDEIYPLSEASPFRAQLGLGKARCVALYSGNMGEKQGMEVVLDAAVMMAADEGIHFVLCGDGVARERLRKQYEGLKNVTWLPLQPIEKLNELLNLADVHLLPQRADVADLVMPSRLLGMLASARPVLATALPNTQVGEAVEQCGVLSPPQDAQAFARALRKLSDNPAWRAQLGTAGRAMARERFSREAVMGKFEFELTEAWRA
jgi:colanic acid biosynthesis glycosyl transferase WcaI